MLSFRRIFDYRGRASRAEFWGFILLYEVYLFLPWVIFKLMNCASAESMYYLGADSGSGMAILQGVENGINVIFELALLSLTVRRLRDAGLSVFWVALYPGMRLVTYFVAKYFPGEAIRYSMLGADSPSTVFVQFPIYAAISQWLTSLSFVFILILCLRKSRPVDCAADTPES